MNYTLRNCQKEGKRFFRDKRRVALFWSMGLGKTLTVLDALEPDDFPALIVAPLRVAKYVWPEEIDQFGFDFSYSFVHGPKKDKRLDEFSDIKIINPEGLKYLFGRCQKAGRNPFKTVIVDESSLFKNCTSKRWKYLRGLVDAADKVVLLTGTPGQHHDLWAQLDLLGDNPLGSYQQFLDRWFEFDYFGRPVINKGAAEEIEALVSPMILRKDIANEIEMPPINVNNVVFDLPAEGKSFYEDVESGMVQINENSYTPLRTTCSGFVYRGDDDGRFAQHIHETKLDLLESILESTNENFLVVTNFQEERNMIHAKFGCPYIDGGTHTKHEADYIRGWNAGEFRMMTMHPASLGHGVRLEKGGTQVLWFSLPNSQELYEQTNARIWRSGQEHPVVVTHLIANDTIEVTMKHLLEKKVLSAASLLDAMKTQYAF